MWEGENARERRKEEERGGEGEEERADRERDCWRANDILLVNRIHGPEIFLHTEHFSEAAQTYLRGWK